ncbi:MAG: glutamyl-tRNA amidotransferase [Sandaracinus sp.]|nr:glutamyl-tRNA amidotransferase [Sandaracinus sp.]|tara:strand:- start:756 stop:1199 length:444 start_codon:yes stop_codon:yes gene_type:complete
MALIETIMKDLKEAMKAKDLVARDTLRMLKAAMTEAEMAKESKLSEDEEMQVLTRAVKTRKESAQQYDEGGRPELAEKERAEVAVIQRYLPKPMSEDEVRAAMKGLAEELGLESKKQMGQLISATMERYRGQVEGRTASRLAGEILS